MNSVIAWRGRSLFTGRPVQVVITGLTMPSKNAKTGEMVQISITQVDGSPSLHFGTEREHDVCGVCPLQGKGSKRICYTAWGPWLLGQHMHLYEVITMDVAAGLLRGKKVRIGSYGDPAAVPFPVWSILLEGVKRWTGYTHAWRTCDPRFKTICMASVETKADYLDAMRAGWRTFRPRLPSTPDYPSEIRCPYETHGTKCEDCGLCTGASGGAIKNIVVMAHGTGAGGLYDLVQGRLDLSASSASSAAGRRSIP